MKASIFSCVVALLFLSASNASAQIVNPKKLLQKKVINKTNEVINKKTDQVVDSIFDNKKNPPSAEKKETPVSKNKADTAVNPPASDQPVLQAYSKYDFIPGDKLILYEDFSQDAVGDFPALWTTDVAGEINTFNLAPGNWLNLNSGEGTYWFMKDINFPQNFILEMDIIPKKDARRIAADLVFFGENKHSEMDKEGSPGIYGLHVLIEKANWSTSGYKKGETVKLEGSSTINPVEENKVNHVIIWVQNRRVRIYHKGAKVIDVPTNIYEGSTFSRFCIKLYRGASCAAYISNIKITTATPDMRNKLLTEGKIVSYGIYFDINKDVVKAESYGSLKEIAKILTENPEVKIKIEGHTDADGADAANLDLSKRRAAAVKNELVNTFGIDAARIETDGKGETQPVAANDTPSNKALNRRVEFIKL